MGFGVLFWGGRVVAQDETHENILHGRRVSRLNASLAFTDCNGSTALQGLGHSRHRPFYQTQRQDDLARVMVRWIFARNVAIERCKNWGRFCTEPRCTQLNSYRYRKCTHTHIYIYTYMYIYIYACIYIYIYIYVPPPRFLWDGSDFVHLCGQLT